MARKLLTLIVTIIFVITGVAAYAAENRPAGIIISMYAGAWVEHDSGVKEPLTLKAPVYVGDLISTDKTGKVQVLFNDDTTLAVAPSSVVDIDEFVFNDTYKPFFSAKLVSGASRVISGKIVEQNPIGFKLSSPHGTAGIRGTIVSARTGGNEDIFFLNSIDHSHTVSISNNKNQDNNIMSSREGTSFIVGDGPDAPIKNLPITQSDQIFLDNAFSSKPVTNNEGTGTNQDSSTGSENTVAKKNGPVSGDMGTDSTEQSDKEDEDQNTPNDKNNVVLEQPKAVTASYTGQLNMADSPAVPFFKGEFGFKVNVSSGIYYDGYMQGAGKGRGVFNATGGTGVVNKGIFTSSGYLFSGTGFFSNMNSGKMSGVIGDTGVIVNDWGIQGSSGSFGGTGSGQGVPLDSNTYKPYEDKVVSFAGTFNTNPNVSPSDSGFGFRLMLVNGRIFDAYLYYADNLAAIKAEGGQGEANARTMDSFGDFAIQWSSSKTQGYGTLLGANGKVLSLQGKLENNDSTISNVTGGIFGDFEIVSGSGSIIDSLPGIPGTVQANYTASIAPSLSGVSFAHNGGTIGFAVNFLTGAIENGGFNILRTVGSETKAIYADGATGTLTGNTLAISWASGRIRDEDRNTTTYNSAKLQGDIEGASQFILTNASGTDIEIDNSVGFTAGSDYTNEKKGTVSGWVSGPNINGHYSFFANLHSGVINNASINISNTTAGELVSNNGSGYIANGKFDIGGYGVNTSSGSLVGYGDVHMNGNNAGGNFTDIQWQIKNGGSTISGTASDGIIK